jgi:hypothetical protein
MFSTAPSRYECISRAASTSRLDHDYRPNDPTRSSEPVHRLASEKRHREVCSTAVGLVGFFSGYPGESNSLSNATWWSVSSLERLGQKTL